MAGTEDGLERAVSPVIGVILMVAIAVILAAVIGAFVLNIGDLQQTPPSTSFTVDQESNTYVFGNDNTNTGPGMAWEGTAAHAQLNDITFSHASGDVVNMNNIRIKTSAGGRGSYAIGAQNATERDRAGFTPNDVSSSDAVWNARKAGENPRIGSGDSATVNWYLSVDTIGTDMDDGPAGDGDNVARQMVDGTEVCAWTTATTVPSSAADPHPASELGSSIQFGIQDVDKLAEVDRTTCDIEDGDSTGTGNAEHRYVRPQEVDGTAFGVLTPGDSVTVVWQASSGGSSQTLFKYTVQ